MSRLKDIPELARDGKNINAVIAAMREAVQTFRGYRGDPYDKALTRRDAIEAGLLNQSGNIATGSGAAGPPGPTGPTGPAGPPGADGGAATPDLNPPPTATGLSVTAGIGYLYIGCSNPSYTQGHGHAVTVVYGAQWPDGGVEPTFANAVELMTFQGIITAYATDPLERWCIWIKWRSVDGVLSVNPGGGTNGVQATTGLTPGAMIAAFGSAWIDNAMIANLSAAKLTAGDGTIGGNLKSSNFVSGTSGWLLQPNGNAEFQEAVVRGTIYASAGTFAGSLVAATGTFAGSLNAATGTFSGQLQAASGSFTGSLFGANITGATGTFSGQLAAGTVDFASSAGSTATYAAAGTYTLTIPVGATSMKVTLIGGGGGGAGGRFQRVIYPPSGTENWFQSFGLGGGAATLQTITLNSLVAGTTYELVVGAAGAGSAPVNTDYVMTANNGQAGGNSRLSLLVSGSPTTLYLTSVGGAGGLGRASSSSLGTYGDPNNAATAGAGPGGGAAAPLGGAAGNATQAGSGGGGGSSMNSVGAYRSALVGGNGAAGYAQVEYFDPNGLVLRSEMSLLKSELRATGLVLS